MTGQTICDNIVQKLGVYAPGDTTSVADSTYVLGQINLLFDSWNAEFGDVYASDLSTFTVTPGLQPHTIGASGATWTAARPVSIESANLIISDIRYPITMRDIDWWMNVRLPTFSTTISYNLNYRATFPNGSCYFWPIPSAAYQVELNMRLVLASIALNTTFTMPPGYQEAVETTVAERVCVNPFGKPLSSDLQRQATQARQRVFTANAPVPRLNTRDEGISGGTPGYFDYQVGIVRD
jgi:hypothetical protein